MLKKTKLVAICGGGDWYDASVDHIVLPVGIDIKKAKEEYNKWLKEVWYKGKKWEKKYPGQEVKYYDFPDFLVELYGGRKATEKDLEIFWED